MNWNLYCPAGIFIYNNNCIPGQIYIYEYYLDIIFINQPGLRVTSINDYYYLGKAQIITETDKIKINTESCVNFKKYSKDQGVVTAIAVPNIKNSRSIVTVRQIKYFKYFQDKAIQLLVIKSIITSNTVAVNLFDNNRQHKLEITHQMQQYRHKYWKQ